MLELEPGVPVLTPFFSSGEIGFSVWGSGDRSGSIPIPVLHRIRIGDPGSIAGTVPMIDWGDVIEAGVEPLYFRPYVQTEPRPMGSVQYYFGDAKAKAELYVDGGLRLALTPRGGEAFSIPLGPGTEGRMQLMDVGRETVLAVIASCGDRMRLILLNKNAEILLEETGTFAGIADGYPCTYEMLGTIRGHERRKRFEYANGSFAPKDESIGFYHAAEREPESDAERAIDLIERLRFGIEGWRGAMTSELAEGTTESELAAFLGDYDRAAVYPMEEPGGRVTIGLISGDDNPAHPRKFVFVFSDGLLTDIEEL